MSSAALQSQLSKARAALESLREFPSFLRVCICNHRQYQHEPETAVKQGGCNNGWQSQDGTIHPCGCRGFQLAGTPDPVAILYGVGYSLTEQADIDKAAEIRRAESFLPPPQHPPEVR